jgi:hypothetical protein
VIASAIVILALGGIFAALNFGDLSAGKAQTPLEAFDEKEMFSAGERTGIARRLGKTATVTGDVAQFREEGPQRFLTFQGAEATDIMLCFVNSEKGDFSTRLLKTFIGQKVTATGVVSKEGKRLLLEVPNMSQLRKQVLAQPPNHPKAP